MTHMTPSIAFSALFAGFAISLIIVGLLRPGVDLFMCLSGAGVLGYFVADLYYLLRDAQ